MATSCHHSWQIHAFWRGHLNLNCPILGVSMAFNFYPHRVYSWSSRDGHHHPVDNHSYVCSSKIRNMEPELELDDNIIRKEPAFLECPMSPFSTCGCWPACSSSSSASWSSSSSLTTSEQGGGGGEKKSVNTLSLSQKLPFIFQLENICKVTIPVFFLTFICVYCFLLFVVPKSQITHSNYKNTFQPGILSGQFWWVNRSQNRKYRYLFFSFWMWICFEIIVDINC